MRGFWVFVWVGILSSCGGSDEGQIAADEGAFSEVDGDSGSPDSASLDRVIKGISYELIWENIPSSWSEIRSIKNDLGYELTFQEAWLGIYLVQLAPCPEEELGWWDPRGWIPTAHAGHDDGTPDSSAFLDGVVEEIGGETSVLLPPVELNVGSYCHLHVLYAETPEFSLLLPEEVHMVGKTVFLSGTWSAEWSPEPKPFTLSSSLGNGALLPLKESVDLSQGGVQFQVFRQLESLFHGMDFAGMDQETLVKKFLLNLVANTRMESTP